MRSVEKADRGRGGDRRSWPVAGGLLIGVGAGLLLMEYNPMALAGLVPAGLGAGLIISAVLSRGDYSEPRD